MIFYILQFSCGVFILFMNKNSMFLGNTSFISYPPPLSIVIFDTSTGIVFPVVIVSPMVCNLVLQR